jgi:hypothetical protein
MKKRIAVIGSVLLLVAMLAMWAVPALAQSNPGSVPPVAGITKANKARVLARLLLVRDEAKVDGFIAKAVTAGKLDTEQAVKVKKLWTERHVGFAKRLHRDVVLGRLLTAKDETRVKAFLDKAVAANKIEQAQADKIIKAWGILHTP